MTPRREKRLFPAAALALAAALAVPARHRAWAQDTLVAPRAQLPDTIEPSIASEIPALMDLKQAYLAHGVNFQLSYLQDTLGNVSGGVQQGATYNSALYMLVDADLAKLAGLTGATFRVNAFQIMGLGLSYANVYNLSTISSIEARPTTRLVELWFEQKLFSDMAAIRVGQLAADTEFFTSEFGGLYVNGTFGWATMFAGNLPGSGPGYPLATPGVRVKLTPNEHLTLLAAIFNGDPAGTGFSGEEQAVNLNGVNFRLRDPALLFGEAQYAWNQDKASWGLAGTVKLGGWYHFGPFNDNHFAYDGFSLADPAGVGVPQTHNGDYALYGVIDQMLWRLPGDDPKKGVAVFCRVAGSPGDRNLINFYAEGGVNFIGLLSQRPNDTFGFGAAYTHMAPSLAAYDQDAAFFSGELSPARDYELALELTYQAVVVPGWTVQPDLQYIVHPGGGA
ncbi:carbohydrate porin, partial [Rhodoblastus sp.]|uniref:carbohydrate porin n=1 Tax=Rhodoblastus sp. TaxID=1962975 RepID=UPI003F97FD4D